MATVDDIRAQLILDTQKWKQGVDQSKRDANDLGNTIRKQKDALQEFGVASAAAFAVMSLAISKTTQQFAQFDQQLANLRSVTNVTADQLKQVKDAAEQFGPAYGKSAATAAEATTEFVKAGIDLQRLAGGELKDALALMVAGELDVGEAASFASNAINTYRDENLKLSTVANIAAGAANASATSVREMADANRQLGPTAASVGLKFEEVNQTLAIFSNNGLRGSDAGKCVPLTLVIA